MENRDEIGESFDVIVDRRPDAVVVGLTGELDLAAADAVAGLVAGELRHLDREVIFDLADLEFIDMAGTRLFAHAVAAVTRSGFACSAVSAKPLPARVIDLSGFADLLGLQLSRTASGQAGDIRARTTAAPGRVVCTRGEATVSTASSARGSTMAPQATPRRTEARTTSTSTST